MRRSRGVTKAARENEGFVYVKADAANSTRNPRRTLRASSSSCALRRSSRDIAPDMVRESWMCGVRPAVRSLKLAVEMESASSSFLAINPRSP